MKNDKQKVLIISPYLPQKDGLAIYTHNLYLELKKFIQCDVYRWEYGGYLSRLITPIFRIIPLFFKIRKYNIIHVQFAPFIYTVYLIPIFLLKGKSQKIVLTVHEDGQDTQWKFIMKPLCKIYFLLSDKLIFHTTYRAHLNCVEKKSSIINTGTVELNKNYKRKIINNRQILLLGFINPWKGHMNALKAMLILKKKFPESKLIIAGFPYSAEYAEQIQNFVKINNLKDNVELIMKWISDDLFENLLMNSEVVILPYERVNMSAMLTWGISFHAPLVISDLSEFQEFCGDNVLYAKVNDPKDFAMQIEKLFSNPNLKNELINKTKILSNRYSWKNTAQKTLEVYKSM